MLWECPAGFAELARVLKPSGRLVATVHRHVLNVEPAALADEAWPLTGCSLSAA